MRARREYDRGRLGMVAAAAVALCVGSCVTSEPAPEPLAIENLKGECHGVNECKGKGECGGPGWSCAGNNDCKGKGWITLTEDECQKRGGKFRPG